MRSRTKPGELQKRIIENVLSKRQDAKINEIGKTKLITYKLGENPVLLIFIGKQKKPYSHCQYPSKEQFKKAYDRAAKEAETYKEMTEPTPHDLKVGDILVSVWGYDQTNADFYQVVKVNSRHYVTIRQIAAEKYDMQYHGTCKSKPKRGEFVGPEMRKKVTNGKITINTFSRAWKMEHQYEIVDWMGR
jgi:hypothetical protein